MLARLRSAVTWLLLLALPLQGLAAATMLNCGPNHQRMVASSLAAASSGHHHEMGAASSAHHHEMAAESSAHHHEMAAESSAHHENEMAAHHHAQGDAGDQHRASVVAAADSIDSAIDSADGDVGPSVQDLNTVAKFKCSACAACCIGLALPTALPLLVSFPPAPAPAFFVPTPHVGFYTDGPDRPPRLLLV